MTNIMNIYKKYIRNYTINFSFHLVNKLSEKNVLIINQLTVFNIDYIEYFH